MEEQPERAGRREAIKTSVSRIDASEIVCRKFCFGCPQLLWVCGALECTFPEPFPERDSVAATEAFEFGRRGDSSRADPKENRRGEDAVALPEC